MNVCGCVCVCLCGVCLCIPILSRGIWKFWLSVCFLVFLEDTIQGKKGTFSLSWNFCTLNDSYASGLWLAQFTLLSTTALQRLASDHVGKK